MRKNSFGRIFEIQIDVILVLDYFMIQLKKPARKLSLRKRFLALTSNEAV